MLLSLLKLKKDSLRCPLITLTQEIIDQNLKALKVKIQNSKNRLSNPNSKNVILIQRNNKNKTRRVNASYYTPQFVCLSLKPGY
jgi:hypothetical protein